MLVCSLVVKTVYAEKDEYCAAVRERIERKIAAVVKYAQLAKQWGFDGVEIHGHHWGYLLDQFAMAYTNHRTDEYGGDLDGRLTFARKIITGIKEACGKDYPVSMRLCMKTYMKGYNQPSLNGDGEVGRDIDEAIEIAKRYEQYGVDMINCNTGSYDAFFYCVSPYYLEKGYNVEYHVGTPYRRMLFQAAFPSFHSFRRISERCRSKASSLLRGMFSRSS